MATEVLTKPIEIFRPGKHIDSSGKRVDVSPEQVRAMVADFNENRLSVPMVPGHPGDDAPQMGRPTRLGLRGDVAVVEEVEDLNPAFKAIVNSGELNRVSIKMLLPGHPDNPTSGHRLRHIGFLGTSRPAIDLAAAQFSHHKQELTLMEDLESDFSEREAEFKRREAEFAAREREFAAKEAAFAKRAKYEPYVEGLVREGKIPPAQKAGFVTLFSSLPDEQTAEFSSGEEKASAAEFLKNVLNGLPKQVNYEEVAGKKKTAQSESSFKTMGDRQVDSDEVDLHDQLLAGGVDPKDSVAYVNALKQKMGGK